MKQHEVPEALRVIARSPFKLYFDGSAQALSATNRVGNFDILPGHADFFSMLEPGTIEIQVSGKEPVIIEASNGILTVRNNEALLFVNM